MKLRNFINSKGNAVKNQFILEHKDEIMFQSYDSIIAIKYKDNVSLDINYWDYSTTTSKYRNQFLGETKKETQAKIDSGEYTLENLNT